MSFIESKFFCFYPSENLANGGSLHWIQPQCAYAYDKLPSMVGSQPIICFLILDCSKYSQMGSSSLFRDLKLEEIYFIGQYDWTRPIFFFLEFVPDFTNFNEKQQGIWL